MRDGLARRPDVVFSLLAGYFLLAVVIRVLRPGVLANDDMEQAFLSQFLLWGYGKQPPFYNWLQFGLAELIGLSVTSITLLKNLCLFAFCVFYGLAARAVISNRSLAYIAMLSVLTMPPVFLLSQRDLSHTVVTLVAVSLLLYAIWQILLKPSLATYALAGVAIGIGVLSKYNFVILPLAAIIAVLPDPEWRQRLFDPRMLVSIAIAALLIAPHAYWFLLHRDEVAGGTLAEMKEGLDQARLPAFILGPVSLAQATVFAMAPTLAAFALVFRRHLKPIIRASDRFTAVSGRMFAVSILLVLLVVLGVGAIHMREKWLVLFIALLPIYLALKVQAAGIDLGGQLREMTVLVTVLAIGGLMAVHGSVTLAHLLGRDSRHAVPFSTLAAKFQGAGAPPALLLASDEDLGGNLKVKLRGTLMLYPNMPVPLPALTEAQKRRVLLVWRDPADPQPPVALTNLAASLGLTTGVSEVEQLDIPVAGANPPRFYSFAYGRLLPAP